MGGWTQTPNFIYDLMPEMKEAEIKVVMLIVRQTIGWQRESASLSVNDFKRMTNLAQASVVSGIKAALDHGIIERTEDKNSYFYKIIEPVSQPESVQNLNRSDETVQNLNENSSKFESITVQNLNSQSVQNLNDTNININTNKPTTVEKKEDAASAAPPDDETWVAFLEAFCWVCHGHKDIGALTKEEKGALTSEAKRVRDKGYTIDDLRDWFRDVWQKDWRWTKNKRHERPKPSQVRSMIPILRDTETPAGENPTYRVDIPDVEFMPGIHPLQPAANGHSPPPLPHDDPWAIALPELTRTLTGSAPRWLVDSRLVPNGELAGVPMYRLVVTQPGANAQWLTQQAEPAIRKKLSSLLGHRVLLEISATETAP